MRVSAYLDSNLPSFRSEYQDLPFCFYCATLLTPSTVLVTQSIELTGAAQSFTLPTITQTPTNSVINITFSAAGAPTLISASGSQYTISATATSGTYSFAIIASDSISGLSTTINFSLTLYSC